MAFELQQLRQVVALAEHGSFVRAASALHISQPALSRSIQSLEGHFGSKLFLRSSGGVVPTDLGRLYVERARDLLRMADELERESVLHGTLRTGRVAVGGGPYPCESFLGPAATAFVGQYPRISVQLLTGDWDELLRRLRSREIDFFVGELSTLRRESDLEVLPMAPEHPLHFVARAGHPLASRGGVTPAELLAWPFVSASRIPPRLLDPMLAAQRDAARRGVVAHPFPSIQCNGLGPVKQIIANSDAVSASILSCIARELEAGELVLLGTQPWLHLDYGIVSLKGRSWPQAAESFRQFVLESHGAAVRQEERLLNSLGKGRKSRPGKARGTRRAPAARIKDQPGGSV